MDFLEFVIWLINLHFLLAGQLASLLITSKAKLCGHAACASDKGFISLLCLVILSQVIHLMKNT